MKKWLGMIVSASLLLGISVAGATTRWDLPTGYPVHNFHTENIQAFVDEVDKATGGRLKITVHPNGSLFRAGEIKRAVQMGQVQIGEVFLPLLANEDPLMGLDGVPLLATSYAEAAKLWRVSRPALESRFARQGMRLLYSVPWPPQGLYTNKPITSGADLRGLKLRAHSPAVSRLAELAGAQPITIQAAELSQALATGTVNAIITSAATGVDTKVWEQLSHFYNIEAWLPKNAVLVSQRAFDALDRPTQEIVLKAAAAAEARGWSVSEERNRGHIDQLAKRGMKVMNPSDQLKRDLAKIGETMTADWVRAVGADGRAIIDAFQK
jgi:TRAP-type C4-dicarboxylate transport system substrate-binding protein